MSSLALVHVLYTACKIPSESLILPMSQGEEIAWGVILCYYFCSYWHNVFLMISESSAFCPILAHFLSGELSPNLISLVNVATAVDNRVRNFEIDVKCHIKYKYVFYNLRQQYSNHPFIYRRYRNCCLRNTRYSKVHDTIKF